MNNFNHRVNSFLDKATVKPQLAKRWLSVMVLSALLTGCANPLETLNCHYQPVRGSLVTSSSSTIPLRLSFEPDSVQDSIWFEQFDLNPEKLTMPLPSTHRIPIPDTRYNAIVNIRTSGNCTPYIVYVGSQVTTPEASGK